MPVLGECMRVEGGMFELTSCGHASRSLHLLLDNAGFLCGTFGGDEGWEKDV
jgi:hypothetical protein